MELRINAERRPSAWMSAFAGLLYAFVSVSMTFFNKAVLNGYNFKHSNAMMLLQMVFTVIFLDALKFIGLVNYPRFNLRMAKKMVAVAVCYCLNVGFALAALRDMNVPMYNVIKRLTTLVVMVNESLILKKTQSVRVKLSVVVIVAGALLAGMTDLDFDPVAYSLALGSCCVQALYLVCVAKAGAEIDLDSFGLVYFNSVMSIPILVGVLVVTDEMTAALMYPDWANTGFQGMLVVSLIVGSLLNYALFFCTNVNSALTTTIIGQFKQIASTALGYFFFGSAHVTAMNLCGVALNTLGGCWYAHVKFQEKKNRSRDQLHGGAPLLPLTKKDVSS